jgi:hypothetical protein
MNWRDRNPRAGAPWWVILTALGYGSLFMLQLALLFLADDWDPATYYTAPGFVIVLTQLFVAALVCWFPISDGNGAQSMVGWLLLVVMYLPRIYASVNFKPGHWIDIFVFGVVVMKWPLTGSSTLKQIFKAYWPFFFALLAFWKEPGQEGRCDVHQPYHWHERLRFNGQESWLLVAFAVGALSAADPYKITRGLNLWSLYAFCTHRFWYHVLPIPYGAVAVYAHIPVFWLVSALYKNKVEYREEQLKRTASSSQMSGRCC